MKKKTSLSIEEKTLGRLKALAKKEKRSVSSLVEKFLSEFLNAPKA
jgi:hypothetical protein